MKSYEALERLAKESGNTMREVSIAVGENETAFLTVLSRSRKHDSSLRASTITRYAEALGYKLCLVPKRYVPKRAVTIDYADEPTREVRRAKWREEHGN